MDKRASFTQPYLWDLKHLADNPALRDPEFGMTEASKKTSYSIRGLRYWFGQHFLQRHKARMQHPLKVCEIGVDRGQMLLYSKGAAALGDDAYPAREWDAMSLKIDESRLRSAGYSRMFQLNIEESFANLDTDYDVVILLHILEHLKEPEQALARAQQLLRPGGIIIGGFPAVPEFLRGWHEKNLRRKAGPWGHVSAFSAARVRAISRNLNMEIDCLTGTFLIRSSGSFLENHAFWIRLNLLYGACLPSYAGELYWVMRKPV